MITFDIFIKPRLFTINYKKSGLKKVGVNIEKRVHSRFCLIYGGYYVGIVLYYNEKCFSCDRSI